MGKKFKTAIIDADPLVYRIGFGMEEVVSVDLQPMGDTFIGVRTTTPSRASQKLSFPRPQGEVFTALKMFIDMLVNHIDAEGIEVWLSGPEVFRSKIATQMKYKGNRENSRRPYYYDFIRETLVAHFGGKIVNGIEADDACATRLTELGEAGCLATIDKDLLTVSGYHFNYHSDAKRQKGVKFVSQLEAERNFYRQLLTGDAVDHIQGLPKIGDVRATKLLKECETEKEMYEVVRGKYLDVYGEAYTYHHWSAKKNPGAVLSKQELVEEPPEGTERTVHADVLLLENARLLRMLTKWPDEGVDWWTPPKFDEEGLDDFDKGGEEHAA